MDSSTKNIVFSKAGATLTCLICGDSDTYQIGQLDRDKWAKGRHNHYVCKTCRKLPPHVLVFPNLLWQESQIEKVDSIEDLLEMIDD
jgi:hypothetical protein